MLNTDGHCLLRNVPTSDRQVAKMAELIAPVVNTIYGDVSHLWTIVLIFFCNIYI